MTKLIIKNLTKTFDDVVAVDNLSFEAENNEFVALIGPSGCGKSTTLNMIAGLEQSSSGDIFIGEKRVNDLHPKDRDIAMVFQNYALYPHMDVYRNMAFGLSMRGFAKKDIETRIFEAADILGIRDLLSRKPKELSGGQRQRVALGRAIVRKPEAFLFDEPLSNLDAKLRVQMRAELTKLHRRLNTTMVYVTHDQVEAMTMATRIVMLKNGVCQQIGPPMALYNNPVNTFVAGFLGTPPMNIIPARVVATEGRLHIATEGFFLPVPDALQPLWETLNNTDFLFGIRPEHLQCRVGPKPENTEKAAYVQMEADIIETLGSHLQISINCGQKRLIATANPSLSIEHGQSVVVAFDTSKMHAFELESPHKRVVMCEK